MKVKENISKRKSGSISFRPDFICNSVRDIDFEYLKKLGITTCFIDLDGTVVSRGTFEVDPAIMGALEHSGLNIHIATNRPKSRSLKTLKENLHADSVIHPKGLVGKPAKQYYLNALRTLGLKSYETVMIGDRFLQDIFGANRAGLYSMVVYKLGMNKNKIDTLISGLERKSTDSLASTYRDSRSK